LTRRNQCDLAKGKQIFQDYFFVSRAVLFGFSFLKKMETEGKKVKFIWRNYKTIQ